MISQYIYYSYTSARSNSAPLVIAALCIKCLPDHIRSMRIYTIPRNAAISPAKSPPSTKTDLPATFVSTKLVVVGFGPVLLGMEVAVVSDVTVTSPDPPPFEVVIVELLYELIVVTDSPGVELVLDSRGVSEEDSEEAVEGSEEDVGLMGGEVGQGIYTVL